MSHVLAEDLRAAVLQAAMEGKLTQQSKCRAYDDYVLVQQMRKSLIKKRVKTQPVGEDTPFDIPQNWIWVRIGDVIEINLGFTYRPQYTEKGIYFLSVKDISSGRIDFSNARRVSVETYENAAYGSKPKRGDILFGRVGTMGKPQIVDTDTPFCIFVSLGFFRDHSNLLNKKYVSYWMQSSLFSKQVEENVKGSAQKNLNTGWLKDFFFPFAPLEEQQRIVERVEELMAKIDEYEKLEKQLVELKARFPEDMKAALLQAAMEGKLTEQRSGETIDDIREQLIIDKKLEQPEEYPFDIPRNWGWIQLGNLGESLGTDSFSDGPFGSNLKREHQILRPEVRIIQLSNIGENGWKDDNEKYTSYDHLENVIPRCEVFPGQMVIAKMMPAGRTIIVPDLKTRITLGSDAMKFNPNPILNKDYLLYAMHSQAFLGQVYADVHGITRVRTTLKRIKTYALPIPPLAEQKRIVEKLDQLLPLCDELAELSA